MNAADELYVEVARYVEEHGCAPAHIWCSRPWWLQFVNDVRPWLVTKAQVEGEEQQTFHGVPIDCRRQNENYVLEDPECIKRRARG